MQGWRSDLDGEVEWWPKGVPESLLASERGPPGQLGQWLRQRLRPLLHSWLYPCVWSMLLLAMGAIASLLDSRANLHPAVGALLLFSAPLLLGVCLLLLISSRRSAEPLQVLVRGLLSRGRGLWFTACLVMFSTGLLRSVPADSNFWILFLIPTTMLWLEWWVVGTFALSSASARWVRSVDESAQLPIDEMIAAGWRWCSERTDAHPGTIAVKRSESGTLLELSVERFSDQSWLVLSWWQVTGVRRDPFTGEESSDVGLPFLFGLLGHCTARFDSSSLAGLESLST